MDSSIKSHSLRFRYHFYKSVGASVGFRSNSQETIKSRYCTGCGVATLQEANFVSYDLGTISN